MAVSKGSKAPSELSHFAAVELVTSPLGSHQDPESIGNAAEFLRFEKHA